MKKFKVLCLTFLASFFMHPLAVFGAEIVRPELTNRFQQEEKQREEQTTQDSIEAEKQDEHNKEQETNQSSSEIAEENIYDVSDLNNLMKSGKKLEKGSELSKKEEKELRKRTAKAGVKFVNSKEEKKVPPTKDKGKLKKKIKYKIKGTLPQTGESNSYTLIFVGIFLIASCYYITKRKIKGGDGY